MRLLTGNRLRVGKRALAWHLFETEAEAHAGRTPSNYPQIDNCIADMGPCLVLPVLSLTPVPIFPSKAEKNIAPPVPVPGPPLSHCSMRECVCLTLHGMESRCPQITVLDNYIDVVQPADEAPRVLREYRAFGALLPGKRWEQGRIKKILGKIGVVCESFDGDGRVKKRASRRKIPKSERNLPLRTLNVSSSVGSSRGTLAAQWILRHPSTGSLPTVSSPPGSDK